MLLDRIPPHHVTLARQVQAVVGVTLVQPPLVVGQRPPDIEVGDFLLVAQRFEPLVQRHDLTAVLVVFLELGERLAVDGQDALHIDLRPARLGLETVDEPGHIGHDLVGRNAGRQVVDADHQKQFLGMPPDDRVETVEQPPRAVAADAAVLDVAVVEQLGPLAAVGDRVAQEHDVARIDREHLEKAAPLEVVFALRKGRAHGEQRGGKDQDAFHSRQNLSSRR